VHVRALGIVFVLFSLGAACSPQGGSGGPGEGGFGGSGSHPTGPLVDASCVDGRYAEELPDASTDITDLTSAYAPAQVNGFVLDVLDRRYPVGNLLVSGGLQSFDCIGAFLSGKNTPGVVIASLQTVVHECGHLLDGRQGRGGKNAYVLTEALTLSCAQGDSVARGGKTFERSRIRTDAYQPSHPPCSESGGGSCDFYADIYLDGDPDDGKFQGGDQGFNMLLEETVQYVNSLATAYAFNGELNRGGSTSARDGILNFLWYVERYLHLARTRYPDAYAHLLSGDGGCWRRAILTVWGRAWLYLEATRGMDFLGIADEELEGLVETPELLAEIQALRDAEGCPAP